MKLKILFFIFFILVPYLTQASDCLEILKKFQIRESEYAYRYDHKHFEEKIMSLKRQKSLQFSELGKIGDDSIYAIELGVSKNKSFKKKYKILITAGVHGNEPLGVTAALNLIEHFLKDPKTFEDFEITVVPNINPWGLRKFERDNHEGVDVNRSFFHESQSENARILSDFLRERKSYDMALDLHGAFGKTGFFIIKAGDDEGVAKNAIHSIEDNLILYPLNKDGIRVENFPEQIGPYHIQGPGVTETSTEGTLKSYFKEQQIPYSYTLEYPGFEIQNGQKIALDKKKQTRMLAHLVRSMMFSMRKIGRTPQSTKLN